MNLTKTHHKVSNYRPVNELIQPKKYRGIGFAPPYTNQKQIDKSISSNSSLSSSGQEKQGVEKTGNQANIQKKENNTGLPENLKTGVENLSGFSMDGVRVHYNSTKPAQIQALAFTQGPDIHVAPGQEKHLPHEAWHVVQQMQGRVQPTFQMKGMGVNINDEPRLEKEADEMGLEAIHRKKPMIIKTSDNSVSNKNVLQPKWTIPDYGESAELIPVGILNSLKGAIVVNGSARVDAALSNIYQLNFTEMTTPYQIPAGDMTGDYSSPHSPPVRPQKEQLATAYTGKVLHHIKTGTVKNFEGGHIFPHALSSSGDSTCHNPYQNLAPMTYEQNHGSCEEITRDVKGRQGHPFRMNVRLVRDSFYITMSQLAKRLGFTDADLTPAKCNDILGPIRQHNPSEIHTTITDTTFGSPPAIASELPAHERPTGTINNGTTLMDYIIASGGWNKLTPGLRAHILTLPNM